MNIEHAQRLGRYRADLATTAIKKELFRNESQAEFCAFKETLAKNMKEIHSLIEEGELTGKAKHRVSR